MNHAEGAACSTHELMSHKSMLLHCTHVPIKQRFKTGSDNPMNHREHASCCMHTNVCESSFIPSTRHCISVSAHWESKSETSDTLSESARDRVDGVEASSFFNSAFVNPCTFSCNISPLNDWGMRGDERHGVSVSRSFFARHFATLSCICCCIVCSEIACVAAL